MFKFNRITAIVIINIIVLLSPAVASSAVLKGKIFGIDGENNKIELPKATIFWLGTATGAVADNHGEFSIDRPVKAGKIIARYVGYQADTIDVPSGAETIEIVLKSGFRTEDITVYGKQQSTQISMSNPVKSEVITSRGLLKAACCNLSESFETNPSVDVSFTDAITGAKQIKLLGLEGSYTQMLTENIPNMNGLASSFGLNYIPGTWMESIQISKGAASVQSGYESITGQINVEYKKPEADEPALLNIYANDFGRFEGNLDVSKKFSENISTMLFAHGDIMRTELDKNFDGFLDKPMVSQINLMNRWKIESGIWESMTLFKGLYENRQGGQLGFFPSRLNNLYGMDIETQRYEFFTKNGLVLPGERYQSFGSVVSFNHHKQNSFFGRNPYDAYQNTFYGKILFQSSFDSTGHSDANEGKHNYSVGFSYLYDEFNETFRNDHKVRIESVPGIFGEYTFSGMEGLTAIAGLRADFHNLYGTFITPRFHVKYNFTDELVVRASAGKGYHVPDLYSDNSGLMASSREFVLSEEIRPEEAWNYGLNLSWEFSIFNTDFTFHTELYRTDFINQLIVDLEQDPSKVIFYNLKGKSYSNSFQTDLMFEPFSGLEITTAYRLNDVMMTINNELIEKPLLSRNKAFINFAYSTDEDSWKFDLTAEYNGKGRLPNTDGNPQKYRLPDEYPAFFTMMGQVTKSFGSWELYLGCENLLDYKQHNPIIAYDDPFGKYFDSSMVWGPIMGREIYMGFRLNI